MKICGKDVKIGGKLLRIARLDGEKYNSPGDLEEFLDALKKSKKRVDLFSFMQPPPQTEPNYSYPMELDNLAVLPSQLSTTGGTIRFDLSPAIERDRLTREALLFVRFLLAMNF